ncbi:MAG: hypothetical protein ACE5QV_08720, partial [Fidelibacterota bacterium]
MNRFIKISILILFIVPILVDSKDDGPYELERIPSGLKKLAVPTVEKVDDNSISYSSEDFNPSYLNSLISYLKIANALEKGENYPRSIHYMKKAMEMSSILDDYILFRIGRMKKSEGEDKEFERILKLALKKVKNIGLKEEILLNLALLYQNIGEYSRSNENYKLMLKYSRSIDDSVKIFLHMGKNFMRLKKFKE